MRDLKAIFVNKESKEKNCNAGLTWYFIFTIHTANLLVFAVGTTASWFPPVIGRLQAETKDNPLERPITEAETAWLGAASILGAVFGPSIGSLASAKLGRKKSLIITAVPPLIAFVTLAFTRHIEVMIAIKVFGGLSTGALFAVMPVYLTQVSRKDNRGMAACLMKVYIQFGIFIGVLIGPYLSIMAFSLTLTVPLILFLVVFTLFMPETPHYLILRGDETKAIEVLKKLGSDELNDIKEVLKNDEVISFSDVWRCKKALGITSALMILQQFSGYNAVLNYSTLIFEETKDFIPPHVSTIIINLVQLIVSLCAILIVDRIGRKIFLLSSTVLMTLTLCLLGAYFQFPSLQSYKFLPTLFLLLYSGGYSLGVGPIPYLIMAELLPLKVKERCSGISVTINWLSAFIVTQSTPSLISINLQFMFWLFALFCFLMVPLTVCFIPETKGRSLKQLEEILT